MPYICVECGNDENFRGTEDRTEYVTATCILDRDGYCQDTLETDYGDCETNDTRVDSCDECGEESVYWVDSEAEIDKVKEMVDENIDRFEIIKQINDGTLLDNILIINEKTNWKEITKPTEEDD